jgi:hypothetical protein
VYLHTVARQLLSENVTAATNTRNNKEFLGAPFSVRFLACPKEAGDSFFPE